MFYKYTDEKIRYIGRWAPYENTMTAVAPGSHFKLSFKGRQAVLRFDIEFNQTPVPHLWISVDGGAKVETPVDRFIRIDAQNDGEHTVWVIIKGMVEYYPRWKMPLANKVSFVGVEADELTETMVGGKKTIEIVGDSITEGVLTDPHCAPWPIDESKVPWQLDEKNRPWQDDATATYAWTAAEILDLEPIIMGFGATGTGKSGCGGVPSAPEAYPYCFEGAPITYPHPDYVLINHGTNDRPDPSDVFKKNYSALLDTIYAAHPDTKIICMSPFIGAHKEDIQDVVALYKEKGNDVLFVNGSDWLPPDPLHPARAAHKKAGELLAAELKKLLNI